MTEYALTPFGRLVQRSIAEVEEQKRKEGEGMPRIPKGEVGLILARFKDEGITMTLPDGQEIHLRVVEFRPGPKVRLGIKAPESVRIMRDELIDREAEHVS